MRSLISAGLGVAVTWPGPLGRGVSSLESVDRLKTEDSLERIPLELVILPFVYLAG